MKVFRSLWAGWPRRTDGAAANVARARAFEARRREGGSARALLKADMPWLDDAVFPAAEVWRPLVDLQVQPTGPEHAWYWGGGVAPDAQRVVIPAGTQLGRPRVVKSGPPVGAYVCAPVPEDSRDDEPWWIFSLAEPVAMLMAGAMVELRPRDGTVFVPDGHPALGDSAMTARAVQALDA